MTKPIGAMSGANHDGWGSAIVNHTVGSGKGAEKATLLIHKRRDADKHEKVTDKYIMLSFVVAWPGEKAMTSSMPEECHGRWSTEAGYRNTKNMSIKSRSMMPGVRCFLLKFSLALTNFWALTNAFVSPFKTGVVVSVITITFFVYHICQRMVGLVAARYGMRAGPARRRGNEPCGVAATRTPRRHIGVEGCLVSQNRSKTSAKPASMSHAA